MLRKRDAFRLYATFVVLFSLLLSSIMVTPVHARMSGGDSDSAGTTNNVPGETGDNLAADPVANILRGVTEQPTASPTQPTASPTPTPQTATNSETGNKQVSGLDALFGGMQGVNDKRSSANEQQAGINSKLDSIWGSIQKELEKSVLGWGLTSLTNAFSFVSGRISGDEFFKKSADLTDTILGSFTGIFGKLLGATENIFDGFFSESKTPATAQGTSPGPTPTPTNSGAPSTSNPTNTPTTQDPTASATSTPAPTPTPDPMADVKAYEEMIKKHSEIESKIKEEILNLPFDKEGADQFATSRDVALNQLLMVVGAVNNFETEKKQVTAQLILDSVLGTYADGFADGMSFITFNNGDNWRKIKEIFAKHYPADKMSEIGKALDTMKQKGEETVAKRKKEEEARQAEIDKQIKDATQQ